MNSVSKKQRQEKILSELWVKNYVTIDRLAFDLGVSDITIRRDLDELNKKGKLQRIWGGASLPNLKGSEPPVLQRQLEQVEEKSAIAKKALEYINDGEVIGLESGSTTLKLAEKIAGSRTWKNLQVITNSFPIFEKLFKVEGVFMIFIGGIVDANEMCTAGSLSVDNLKSLRIDKFFCGCRGIDAKFGRSSDKHAAFEINTIQTFSDASAQIFVLADHTKFNTTFMFQLLPISKIDVVITSDLVPPNIIMEFTREGVEIIQAPFKATGTREGNPLI
ncbi:MAG: DeoR/GlpR transcriptional regulator [Anaerolineae bacterium]|nr:DeoR/GlpR transcriptional regulator [Anaerolineae bacterium]